MINTDGSLRAISAVVAGGEYEAGSVSKAIVSAKTGLHFEKRLPCSDSHFLRLNDKDNVHSTPRSLRSEVTKIEAKQARGPWIDWEYFVLQQVKTRHGIDHFHQDLHVRSDLLASTPSPNPVRRRRRRGKRSKSVKRLPNSRLNHAWTSLLKGIRRLLDRAKIPVDSRHSSYRNAAPCVRPLSSISPTSSCASVTSPLHSFGKNGLDSHLLEREVLAAGLATVRLTPTIFFFSENVGDKAIGFSCTASSSTGRIASKIAGQKQLARIVLSRSGVPVPKGQRFSVIAKRESLQYALTLGWPLVVKPDAGWGGRGVSTNIQSEAELLAAIAALQHESHFIIEEHVVGRDYRFLVLGDRVISVIMRDPANIIGDGQRTIKQLVNEKNVTRQQNPHLQKRLIEVDEGVSAELARQRLLLTSVPAAGRRVSLSSAGNLSQGGDSCEVLDETHASLKEMAVQALNAIPGLPHAGIDFLIPDHRLPLPDQRVAICEINSVPATSGHHFPLVGPSRNVSREIVNYHCARAGMQLRPPASRLTVQLIVRGRVQNTGYRKWMAELANKLGIVGWVKNDNDGTVQAMISGPPDLVAIIASLAILGPKRARVEMVETSPIAADAGSAFNILRTTFESSPSTNNVLAVGHK